MGPGSSTETVGNSTFNGSTFNGSAPDGSVGASTGALAQEIVSDARGFFGGLDTREIADRVATLAQTDPNGAANLLEAIRDELSVSQQQRLVADVADAVAERQRAGGAPPTGLTREQVELIVDLGQIALDIVGLADPTPISDGLNGLISLFRGDFVGAGISAVSMVPYIGDAAKLGKLGKWAETIVNAAELLGRHGANSAVGRQLLPALEKINDALNALPTTLLDSLPASARTRIDEMKGALDNALGAASRVSFRNADGAVNLDTAATRYAEAVQSNRPWSWDNAFSGERFTRAERRAIREAAYDNGLITRVTHKPGTRYADFASAGLIERVDVLPENLWRASDAEQFAWLDARLPGGVRPEGMTWHHSEINGRMELVPFGEHNIINHIGGRSPGHWAHGPR